MKLKGMLAVLVVVVLGFLTFIALSGLGLIMVLILKYFPWWHILLGTLGGSLIVFLELIGRIKDK